MPKVSVIIPVYNGARFIKNTIDSVLAQTYKDYEIIVVNDGSIDNTEELLRPYIDKGLIRYFYQENQGSSNARNRAIKESTGEYIAWLDQDDVWLPQRLEKTVKVMDKDDTIGVVAGQVLFVDESDRIVGYPNYSIWNKGIINYCLFPFNRIWTGTVLLRKQCLEENNWSFDQSFFPADDYLMWLQFSLKYKLYMIPEILFLYRKHGSNMSLKGDDVSDSVVVTHSLALKKVFNLELDVDVRRYGKWKLNSIEEWNLFIEACKKLSNLYYQLDFLPRIDKAKTRLYYTALLFFFWWKNRTKVLKDVRVKDLIKSIYF